MEKKYKYKYMGESIKGIPMSVFLRVKSFNVCLCENCNFLAAEKCLICTYHLERQRCLYDGCRTIGIHGLCEPHRRSNICKVRDCTNSIRSRRLCFHHGGGKRCAVPYCNSGAVSKDLCKKVFTSSLSYRLLF